jgi:prevent-host-death family protein
MASFVALTEAQAKLPELLDRVERGEEISIQREGRTAARLIPATPGLPVTSAPLAAGERIFGQNLLGITYIATDFDAPMTEEDLKEWGY